MSYKSAYLLIFACLLVFVCQSALQAQDAKDLEKQINTELRNAQSTFFNGKFEASEAGIKKSSELIESLKKLEPQHKQLKSFEQRLTKLQSDLAKKLGKTTSGSSSVPVATQAPAKSVTSPSKSDKLPRKTAQEIKELTKSLDSLENYEKDRMLRIQQDYSSYSIESTFSSIQQKIDNLPGLLEKVAAMAAQENAGDHPDVIAVQERVAAVSAWATLELAKTQEKVAQQKAGEAAGTEAADSLKKQWEDYNDKYFNPINNRSHENDIAKIGEAFELLNEYADKKADLTKAISAFEEKYGNTREAIEAATGGMEAVYPWENFKKAMVDIEAIPGRLGEKVNGMIEQEISSLSSRHDFFRLERHAEIKKLEEFCKKYVAGYTANASIASQLAEDIKKFEEKVDQRNWPAGKGSAADRAGALEYFKNTWGKDEKQKYTVLGTVITGEWSVQKKDLLGKPVMYGLPVLLAVQKPEDKTHGLARVYILTVRTPESASAQMAPPFDSDTVGDCYYIRAEKVK
ncbi:MAG: hypothetical protein KKB51_18850 [Candidatus Riflebacteria bacterium]|nr:hypothetical protein [Candidatus Riflebacteria bacterium]